MLTLKSKISLLPAAGKRAVTELAHITEAIIANIQDGAETEETEAAILEQSMVGLLSDFDAEIGKHKQIKRFLDAYKFTPFTTAIFKAPTDGEYFGEVLNLAQPLDYATLRLRGLSFESNDAVNGATVRVVDLKSNTALAEKTHNITIGYNVVDLSTTDEAGTHYIEIDADSYPVSVKVGLIGDGVTGFRPIQDLQLTGRVKRGATANVLVQTKWELIVDMRKIANEYALELEEAYWYKCGITVLNWNLKSQKATRVAIVGREEMKNNRDELQEDYKKLVCNAVRKIIELIEHKPATKNDIRFDVGYEVGSIV